MNTVLFIVLGKRDRWGRKGNGGRGREDGEKRGRCCRLLDPFITSAENLSDFSLFAHRDEEVSTVQTAGTRDHGAVSSCSLICVLEVLTLQCVKMSVFFLSRGERSDELTEKLMEVSLQKIVTKL